MYRLYRILKSFCIIKNNVCSRESRNLMCNHHSCRRAMHIHACINYITATVVLNILFRGLLVVLLRAVTYWMYSRKSYLKFKNINIITLFLISLFTFYNSNAKRITKKKILNGYRPIIILSYYIFIYYTNFNNILTEICTDILRHFRVIKTICNSVAIELFYALTPKSWKIK